MAFLDDWNWDNIANAFARTAVPAVTSLVGSSIAAKANTKAAQIAQQNADANRAAIAAGTNKAVSTLQPEVAAGAPATEYMQSIMARDPNQMTPQQEIQLADSRRTAVNMTPAGLSGSGRYKTAMLNDITNRGKAAAVATNTARSDTAANTLAGRGAGAVGTQASLEAGMVPQITAQNTDAANAVANAGTATAGSDNSALAQIGSYFANAQKQQQNPTQQYKLVPTA